MKGGAVGVLVLVLLCCCLYIVLADGLDAVAAADSRYNKYTGKAVDAYDHLLQWSTEQLRTYTHVWPTLEFGWRIVAGTTIGFLGAAFGSAGGVGGGGIFVPTLALVIGFDAKSSTAISKCMITGLAAATVSYNLKRKHPTLDLPLIDYDLALLIQPMLVLGISIGVTLNVVLAEWMITVLLIIFFLASSIMSFLKGIKMWKKETISMKETAELQRLLLLDASSSSGASEYQPLPTQRTEEPKVSLIRNVRWGELGILFTVWVAFLTLQISKNNTTTCSVVYWVINLLQIPVAVGVSSYQAMLLYKGKRKITSRGEDHANPQAYQLVIYCLVAMVAGALGGMLGLGGGFVLGPLFLELGIPPQVSSATTIFAMTFSASVCAVEYYLLKRFPVPYTLYLVFVATMAALAGQHVVRRVIAIIGRTSLIVFILAFTIFISAIFLGGKGIFDAVEEIKSDDYMGFQSLCSS